MTISPLKTEKILNLSNKGIYAFVIDGKTTKQEIKKVLEKEFNITIVSIRIQIRKGKPMRFNRGKRAYPGMTTRADQRIAFVTLKAGDKLKIFDEDVEESKDDVADKKTVTKVQSKDSGKKEAGLFAKRRTGNRGDK